MMLAGGSPSATELFYSYPPPVAQAMQLVACLPDGVVLLLWSSARRLASGTSGPKSRAGTAAASRTAQSSARRVVAVAAMVLPFAVAILFGNLDVWYPARHTGRSC